MSTTSTLETPEQVLQFWFGKDFETKDNVEYITNRMGFWFAGKSKEFDQAQRENSELVSRIGKLDFDDITWLTPYGALARIIVLDQFPRCIFRGQAKAFEYDAITSTLAVQIINKGLIPQYSPVERFFIGVALQHSEDLAMQKLGVDVAQHVADDSSQEVREFFRSLPGYPMEHHDVISRFGRFPSRNAALVSYVAYCISCCIFVVNLSVLYSTVSAGPGEHSGGAAVAGLPRLPYLGALSSASSHHPCCYCTAKHIILLIITYSSINEKCCYCCRFF